ncbi:MAG: hypothetical protein B5766_03880 [Candidatus Lumbricidophila eiseniae]|uniref:RNA-binding S4 domain-containing protein n=1 Tax=Candidatus Lumbricidiphila eiseniae TaxID=1969409 RepID=A0A2A6FSI2_9MICO|nr:MAG: hypothetical protein B5766_03880 [Candidatus Lumbricidophila eiseniae]
MNGSERVGALPATEARIVGAPVGAGSGGDSLESEPECWFGPGTGVLGGGSLEGEQEGTLDSDEAGSARVGQRLDALLAQRGLARSRTHATALIAAGLVTVDGHPVTKNSYRVPASSAVAVAASDHWVSRAALKLIAALDAFAVDPRARVVLDAGASTGGFSQVLCERGSRRVLAVDVGHGQFSSQLRGTAGLVVVEGCNVRELTAERLAALTGEAERPSLVTADLSFISLTTVLPALCATATAAADFVLLIKPQFEVGRSGVREGIVRDPALRAAAVMSILRAAYDLGLNTVGVCASSIVGEHGNHEYFVHLARFGGVAPNEWMSRVESLAGQVPLPRRG